MTKTGYLFTFLNKKIILQNEENEMRGIICNDVLVFDDAFEIY